MGHLAELCRPYAFNVAPDPTPDLKIVLHPPLHRTDNKKAHYQIDSRLFYCTWGG